MRTALDVQPLSGLDFSWLGAVGARPISPPSCFSPCQQTLVEAPVKKFDIRGDNFFVNFAQSESNKFHH